MIACPVVWAVAVTAEKNLNGCGSQRKDVAWEGGGKAYV
jgi:hypothetical protein